MYVQSYIDYRSGMINAALQTTIIASTLLLRKNTDYDLNSLDTVVYVAVVEVLM